MRQKFLVWFEEVNKEDVGLVGGKGANLGEMTCAHLPIPYGFIVTSYAYFLFLKEAKIEGRIKEFLANVNVNNSGELNQASDHIQNLILNSPVPPLLIKQIYDYYDNLLLKEAKYLKLSQSPLHQAARRLQHIYSRPLVAVRSSATAEDLPNASFAGQQETYLNVRGENHLLQKIRQCWASLFTARAIYYRHEQGFDHFKIGLAAVIQRMIQSQKSGIAFSIDPVTNDRKKIVIEAIFGLGEYIVQGKVTPDHYEVDKNSFVLLKQDIKYQNAKYVKKGLSNVEIKLSKSEGSTMKLLPMEITKLALLVKDIEKHYYFPQDIEWAIENGRIFIVQSRPITTVKSVGVNLNQSKSVKADLTDLTDHNRFQPLLVGSPASPGIGVGPVCIIHTPREIDKVHHGDVLVAPQTNPDYVPAMKKASAIVTDKGGRTSHAAIVSRELGIPAVVGTETATKILKNNSVVTVNGQTGEIFQGGRVSKHLNSQHDEQKKTHHKTLTKIYVNLAEPEQADKVAQMDVDGVGLLRAEFMIAEIGVHPKEFIKQKKENQFVNRLVHDLRKFARAFNPRPIIYRATDFKTNEYRHLQGGQYYEPKEENPMLGFRGAARYIVDPASFNLELMALNRIWDEGYRNLHLMIPFVRAPWELVKIKQLVASAGLFARPGFKLLIMVEVPACALNLEEFLKIGVDGVSIGTNDLTMMLLGVDRDNSEVAGIYDERTPLIVKVLEEIVATCNRYGVTASICGQAASDYSDLVETLVKAGITSVSINPDAVDRTRDLIYHIEKKHFALKR